MLESWLQGEPWIGRSPSKGCVQKHANRHGSSRRVPSQLLTVLRLRTLIASSVSTANSPAFAHANCVFLYLSSDRRVGFAKMPDFIPGLELSELFYQEAV